VGLTQDGKLFRTAGDQAPKMSGREAPVLAARVDTHQNLYIVAQTGKCAALAVHTIPVSESMENGVNIRKITTFADEDKPLQFFSLPPGKSTPAQYVVTISRQGLIKKSELTELPGASSQTFVLAKVNDGDEVCECLLVGSEKEYLVATRNGMAIRFEGEEVRSMGLVAAGVNAVKLAEDDLVAGMTVLRGKEELQFVCSDGSGWHILESEFPLQKRYGQGVIVGKLKEGTRVAGVIYGKKNQSYTAFFAKSVAKNFRMDGIASAKRSSVAKKIIELKPGDAIIQTTTSREFVAAVTPIPAKKGKEKNYKQENIF
jgi:DNA gyrase/topoisomerase IV subunit A